MLKKFGVAVLGTLAWVKGPVSARRSEVLRPKDDWSQGGHGLVEAYLDKLGLTHEEIRAAYAQGQSVEDLAKSRGINREHVETALEELATEYAWRAVRDGRLTQEQAEGAVACMGEMLERWSGDGGLPDRPARTFLGARGDARHGEQD